MKAQSKWVVRLGSSQVRIFRTPCGKYDGYTLTYYLGGRRVREKRSTLASARERANEVLHLLSGGRSTVLAMTDADVASYARAVEQLVPINRTLDHAVGEYSGLVARLGKVPLAVAVDFYLSRHSGSSKPVGELVGEFLAARRQDGIGDRHYDSLEDRLALFSADFQCQATDVTGAAIDAWLRHSQEARKWSGQTRNHYRAAISNLMNFAVSRRYLPLDWAEMRLVPAAQVDRGDVQIFTPDQAESLLTRASKTVQTAVPYLALAFFVGARHSEIERLQWDDIGFGDGLVFIGQGKVRTAGHRLAPLSNNCAAWLDPLRGKGRVCPRTEMSQLLRELAPDDWIHNGPRHSFISYRLAQTKNLEQVSEESGTSPSTLRKHYRRPIAESEAVKYFSISPK